MTVDSVKMCSFWKEQEYINRKLRGKTAKLKVILFFVSLMDQDDLAL